MLVRRSASIRCYHMGHLSWIHLWRNLQLTNAISTFPSATAEISSWPQQICTYWHLKLNIQTKHCFSELFKQRKYDLTKAEPFTGDLSQKSASGIPHVRTDKPSSVVLQVLNLLFISKGHVSFRSHELTSVYLPMSTTCSQVNFSPF